MIVKEYRQRPAIIEASEPLTEENGPAIAEWIRANGAMAVYANGVVVVQNQGADGPESPIRPGDRACRGVGGEFYAETVEVFALTYEPNED